MKKPDAMEVNCCSIQRWLLGPTKLKNRPLPQDGLYQWKLRQSYRRKESQSV